VIDQEGSGEAIAVVNKDRERTMENAEKSSWGELQGQSLQVDHRPSHRDQLKAAPNTRKQTIKAAKKNWDKKQKQSPGCRLTPKPEPQWGEYCCNKSSQETCLAKGS
jgi:hypothetical protein